MDAWGRRHTVVRQFRIGELMKRSIGPIVLGLIAVVVIAYLVIALVIR